MALPPRRDDWLPDIDDFRHMLWRAGDLSWKLDSLQTAIRDEIYRLNAKSACILSSRQIGKSFLAVVMALEWCIRHSLAKKRFIARVVAPTLKQVNDIVNDNLSPIMADAPAGLIERVKSEYRWKVLGKCEMRLGALERAHVDGNRGGNAGLIIYEECGFVNSDDFVYGVNSVLGPQLLRSGGVELFISSPSEEPEHPLHTVVLPQCSELGTAFQFTVYDSPSVTKEQIAEAMRRCGGENTDAWKREYLAMIIRPTSLVVIPSYHEAVHVRAFVPPTECHWHITIDFGGVRDRTVALLHTYDFNNDVDLIYDERHWPSNTPTSDIIEGLRELAGDLSIHWTADIPGQLQIDLANAYDLQVSLPPKTDWTAAVNQMAVRFSTEKVLVHERCEFLRKSCKGATFNKHRTDFDRNASLGHMDALAALMYALRSQNRENPYAKPDVPRDRYFQIADPAQDLSLATTFQPRLFPGVKTSFGRR